MKNVNGEQVTEFNSVIPIDITTLDEEEKKQAFHEWAEGSIALEELFKVFDKKGLITIGSCSGEPEYHQEDTGEKPPMAYVAFLIDDSQIESLKTIYDELIESRTDCKIVLIPNPNYKGIFCSITCDLKNREEVFSQISKVIKEPNKDLKHEKEFNNFLSIFRGLYNMASKYNFLEDDSINAIEECKENKFKRRVSGLLDFVSMSVHMMAKNLSKKFSYTHNKKMLNSPTTSTPDLQSIEEEKRNDSSADKFKLSDSQLIEYYRRLKERISHPKTDKAMKKEIDKDNTSK